MQFNKKVKGITVGGLLFIFLVSFIFRVAYLGSNLPGLYNDELYFLLSAYAQLHHISYLTVSGYNLPAFIFYTINGYIPVILLFHSNPFSARLPVAIYGSLIIFPLYLLSNELLNNRKISILATFLWAISPTAIITSRVGYGIEIFPLFLFLFFLFFWLKFLNTRKISFFFSSLSFIIPIIFFSAIRVEALIPLVGITSYTILLQLRKRIILRRYRKITLLEYVIFFVIGVATIWLGLLYSTAISSLFGFSNLIVGVSKESLLVSESFPNSILEFFIRIGYALSPWKMFWFGEFTARGLNYGPVNVPSMFLFTLPFFYTSVFGIPIFFRKDRKIMEVYCIVISLMLFGLIEPVFNLTNPAFAFEPSEGIFALPFYSILVAFSMYLFFTWVFKSLNAKDMGKIRSENTSSIKIKINYNKKAVVSFLIIVFVMFAGINITNFSSDLYISSNEYYQNNNNTINYMFYGWNHVSNYLVSNHLCNETMYYTPGREGPNYNLTNNNNFNYWFFHQNFPLYWLYTYSNGKIKKINPLYYGSTPPVPENYSIVLSQYPNYSRLLWEKGINNTVLYSVDRENGKPAIQVIQIYDALNRSYEHSLLNHNIFCGKNISRFESVNLSSLENVTSQITVSVKFSISASLLQTGRKYNLLNSLTPSFSIGIWPANNLIDGTTNTSFIPVGAIYTNYGNYSAPNSWQRLYGYSPLEYNITYMVTLTFFNKLMSLYINSTLISEYQLKYPLYPLSSTFCIDSNINANILRAEIFNIALNQGEVGYINYHSDY